MLIITPIPNTGYKAIWNTVTDSFFKDANGDEGWDAIDDIDISNMEHWEGFEFMERISLLW